MICGKIIYKSQSDAKQVIAGVNADKRPNKVINKPHVAYFCEDCNGWHVASRSKRRYFRHNTEQIRTIKNGKKIHPQDQVLKIRNYTHSKRII